MIGRRRLFLGMIASTALVALFFLFVSLWRTVPHWWVGQWSLRTQYALTQASSVDGLLRDYHRALDYGDCRVVHALLVAQLRDPELSPEERDAILKFYSLRVPSSRAPSDLFTLGPQWVDAVLDATAVADAEVRSGAVFFMEGLCLGRRLYKPRLWRDREGPAANLSEDEVVERMHAAFREWSTSPERRNQGYGPFVEGIIIIEP